MALAILKLEDSEPGLARFRFEMGSNRYYSYAVGNSDSVCRSGVRLLDRPSYVSPVEGPIPEASLGRGSFIIPEELLDCDRRSVQLMSFRTADRKGPAVSKIISIPRASSSRLPEISWQRSLSRRSPRCYNRRSVSAAFDYYPRNRKVSEAMFVESLIGMLPQILPIALPALSPLRGNILNNLMQAILSRGGGVARQVLSGIGSDGGRAVQNVLSNPDTASLISNLVQNAAGGGNVATASSLARARVDPRRYRVCSLALKRCRSQSHSRPPLSHAQVAPALLAALPALMPLLKNVLNPQTIQSVLNAPQKMTGTVINGLKDFARLGIESHEQDLRHLRELNPGVDDPALNQLLASMSLNLGESRLRELIFYPSQAVRLTLEDSPEHTIKGRPTVLRSANSPLQIAARLTTPQPIKLAVFEWTLKSADDLKIHYLKRRKLRNVESGDLPFRPTIPTSNLSGLKTGKDYIVSLAVAWKNRQGRKFGTTNQQTFTLTGDLIYDRTEPDGERIPLSDPTVFRNFWHLVWSSGFRSDRKRFELDTRYYLTLVADAGENLRLETQYRIEQSEDKRVEAKLRSGMELCLASLNRLGLKLDTAYRPLSSEEIRALERSGMVDGSGMQAAYRSRLRGRPGDRGALWTYPDMQFQRVFLNRVGAVDDTGIVDSTTDYWIRIPIPVALHFVGTRTE